jgi:hypothetical protein
VQAVSCENKLLLIDWNLWLYTAQLVGFIPAPLPSTVTQTSIPMSADEVGIVVDIFVSVKRPVTSEGRMSRVTPFPLDVEISASKNVTSVPPLKPPPTPIAHAAPVPAALKLPLA